MLEKEPSGASPDHAPMSQPERATPGGTFPQGPPGEAPNDKTPCQFLYSLHYIIAVIKARSK
jgi:hypothetical protein